MADSGGALVAALPMYDWPELRWATDALWAALAERLRAGGIAAPDRLQRDLTLEAAWRHPCLLFGQTCGWPYVRMLRDLVTVVATPGYVAEGCAGTDYCSMILVRRDEPAEALCGLAGRTAAVNDPLSLSGCLALKLAITAAGAAPPRVRLSGSHRESLRMVARGDADVCAVDAVCWALVRRHEPETAAALRVLAQTPAAPSLPFICAATTNAATLATLRTALAAVLADPSLAEVRTALLLSGAMAVDEAAYDRVVALEQFAADVELTP
jgi:ABC-type phosphate/phosphonate transport system substrate-binding protein